jgi:hypothetical protein
MNIPKRVRICGMTFDVIYKKDLTDEKGQALLGLCDVNECKIWLKKGLVPEKRKEVFLHECLHGILDNLNVKLGNTEKENEDKVNAVGLELMTFIKVNKIRL